MVYGLFKFLPQTLKILAGLGVVITVVVKREMESGCSELKLWAAAPGRDVGPYHFLPLLTIARQMEGRGVGN